MQQQEQSVSVGFILYHIVILFILPDEGVILWNLFFVPDTVNFCYCLEIGFTMKEE